MKNSLQSLEEPLREQIATTMKYRLDERPIYGQGSDKSNYVITADSNLLRCRLCSGASRALLRILRERIESSKFKKFRIYLVETNEVVFESKFKHRYIVMEDYFALGGHLFIDPTLNQFLKPGQEPLLPDFFVGTKSELRKAFQQMGLTNIDSYFDAEPTILNYQQF